MNNRLLRKIFIYIMVIYVISITILVAVLHRQRQNTEMEKLHVRLKYGASLVEHVVPQGYLDRASDPDAISESGYQQITRKITEVAISGDYAYLYAVRNVKGNYYFIVCSISAEQLKNGEFEAYWIPYKQVPETLKTAFKTHEIQYGTYKDEWGSFYSCFIPYTTKQGSELVLGADIDFDRFQSILRKNSLFHFFQLLALLLIMIPIAFLISRIQYVFSRELETNTAILNSAITCILIVSEDAKILFANKSALMAMQMKTEELVHHYVDEPVFKNHAVFECLAVCIRNKESYRGEFPRKDPSGNTIWEYVLIDHIEHKQTKAPLFYVFCQDVTELKLSQNNLQQSNIILAYLTQASHSLLSNSDPFVVIPEVIENLGLCLDKKLVQVMYKDIDTWKTLSNWQKSDIDITAKKGTTNGRIKPELIHWEEKLSRGDVIHAQTTDFPREFLNMIGIHYSKEISLYPIIIDTKLWGMIFTIVADKRSDIDQSIVHNTFISFADSVGTAIKRAKMENQLRIATEAKSSFLSSMSHEIRTPLNGILGMITLLGNTELQTDQKDYLKAMKSAGNQLYSLIGDVLDVSRIEAGKFVLHRAPMNIRGIVQNVQSIVQYQLSEKKLDFMLAVHENVPDLIIADEMRIKQILVNLINNAIKFTTQGFIKLEIELIDTDIIRFDLSDTGIGMTPDQCNSIFEPFYQAGSLEIKSKGTGLGLVITKRLINMMHGNITISSAPGKGSTFSFFIKVGLIQDR